MKPSKGGGISFDLSLAAIFIKTDFTPVIPNLSVGVKYGISDRFNLGVDISPGLILVKGILVAEPYLVYRLRDEAGFIPAINLYSIIPTLLSFETGRVTAYPLLGLLPRFDIGPVGAYLAVEAQYNRNWSDLGSDIRFNARGGLDIRFSENFTMGAEAGVNRIGETSVLYGWTNGQPIVKIGFGFGQ